MMRVVKQFGIVAASFVCCIGLVSGCAKEAPQERTGGSETEPNTPTAPPGMQPPDATDSQTGAGQSDDELFASGSSARGSNKQAEETTDRYRYADADVGSASFAENSFVGDNDLNSGDSLSDLPQSSTQGGSFAREDSDFTSPPLGLDAQLPPGFDPQLVGERYRTGTGSPSDDSSAE